MYARIAYENHAVSAATPITGVRGLPRRLVASSLRLTVASCTRRQRHPGAIERAESHAKSKRIMRKFEDGQMGTIGNRYNRSLSRNPGCFGFLDFGVSAFRPTKVELKSESATDADRDCFLPVHANGKWREDEVRTQSGLEKDAPNRNHVHRATVTSRCCRRWAYRCLNRDDDPSAHDGCRCRSRNIDSRRAAPRPGYPAEPVARSRPCGRVVPVARPAYRLRADEMVHA